MLSQYKYYTILVFLLLITQLIWAQQQKYTTGSKKAIRLYESAQDYVFRRQLPEAVYLLNQALEKDKSFIEAHLRIAFCFKLMNNLEEQKKHLESVLSYSKNSRNYKNVFLALGEACYLLMQYDQALSYINTFLSFQTNDPGIVKEANWLAAKVLFAREEIKNPVEFDPIEITEVINNGPLQYFPVLTADEEKIFYTRREGHHPQFDEDIYVSEKNGEGKWGFPYPISRTINTQYNEGTCSISADGKVLIFTSCMGRRSYGSCDLFISYREGIDWSRPVNMGENINSKYWDSQPALSADGRRLYFVSERPGGEGLRDIWMSEMDEIGNWQPAVNLGPSINTQEDDVSPFIHVNGETMYFASKGYLSFGGYDLYSTEYINGEWTEPKNLGYPVNTPEDQVSLFVTADGKTAYYSLDSWTSKGTPTSTIYYFEIPEAISVTNKSYYVKGKILDAETKIPLKASIELMDVYENQLLSKIYSDSIDGIYTMVLTEGSEYALYVNKPGYIFESRHFSLPKGNNYQPVQMDFYLTRVRTGAVTVLNNVFFDTDKYDLKEKSITELQKVINYMKTNPDLKIGIRGHTDNTGMADYNMNLSIKRAEAVYNYLVDHGINALRLSHQGLGQTEPALPNDSEENRSKNRRIEFMIEGI